MIVTDRWSLLQPCKPVGLEEGLEIIDKLERALSEEPAGMGLAANQIGLHGQVCILRVPVTDGQEQYTAGYNFINPRITKREKLVVVKNEGCLSFPGEVVETLRYHHVTVEDDLEPKGRELTGWIAVCCQHEVDHLRGVIMHSRIKSKIGPNQKCPCDSGKKFKKCCMKELRAAPTLE